MWFITTVYLIAFAMLAYGHESKDFDDSILYKIEFEVPDFEANPDLKAQVKSFFTHDKEQYDCIIPKVEDKKEERKTSDTDIPPLDLIRPLFSSISCSYRIEAYWSYEICHGYHVKQYHEEREGKSLKFQEYYLGKWSDTETELLLKSTLEDRKSGIKYKTIKIENLKYPYFEVEMKNGTLCDILGEPRATKIRYVCYPHGKNEIYSFKETSTCNYEAIILTSLLCMDPNFHPEESKEVAIKCFNSPTESRKPLSLLRQELRDLQMADLERLDFSGSSGNARRMVFINKFGVDVYKIVSEALNSDIKENAIVDGISDAAGRTNSETEPTLNPIVDFSPISNFLNGRSNCLVGGTGWWKYEFCYGRHVRQFHKDKKSETELMLGYFNEAAHRDWIENNIEKAPKQRSGSTSIWHHYEGGSPCDRTGKQRETDVKLTCTPVSGSPSSVSMYLLEPKTCQYILVVESPIICDIMQLVDDHGLVDQKKLEEFILKNKSANKVSSDTSQSTEKSEDRNGVADVRYEND